MLLVCISHCIQRTIPGIVPTKTFDIFYSLHMALFMFVGGFFTKRTDKFKELAKSTGKRFLSYVYAAVIYTILSVFLIKNYSGHDLVYWLKEFVCRTDTFYWYLISAFIIETIFSVAHYISRKILNINGGIGRSVANLFISLAFIIIFTIPLVICFNSNAHLTLFGEGNYSLGPEFLALDLTLFYLPIALIGYILKYFVEYLNNCKN